jgi:hypothetical protein
VQQVASSRLRRRASAAASARRGRRRSGISANVRHRSSEETPPDRHESAIAMFTRRSTRRQLSGGLRGPLRQLVVGVVIVPIRRRRSPAVNDGLACGSRKAVRAEKPLLIEPRVGDVQPPLRDDAAVPAPIAGIAHVPSCPRLGPGRDGEHTTSVTQGRHGSGIGRFVIEAGFNTDPEVSNRGSARNRNFDTLQDGATGPCLLFRTRPLPSAFELLHGRTVAAKSSSFPVRASFHTRWKPSAPAAMPW